jgi:hypothetical protein
MPTHHNSWLDIFAGFRLALSMKKLLLTTCGLFISLAILIALVLLATQVWPDADIESVGRLLGHSFGPGSWAEGCDMARAVFETLAAEPRATGFPYPARAFLIAGVVLLLLVWSLLGGAVCRLAAVEFAAGETCSINDALLFTARKFGSFFWSPLVPFIFVAVLMLGAACVGLLGRMPVVGPPLVGLLSLLAMLLVGLGLFLALCAFFGSVFMWPTIATEGTNAFDAVSRSFNYVAARPWKFIWCSLVAIVYGAACAAFVAAFAWATLEVTLRCLALGMGDAFDGLSAAPGAGDGWYGLGVGALLLRTFILLAWGLVGGFIISLKLSEMTLLYFVLRRDVDGADMSEVYLPLARDEGLDEAPPDSAPPSLKAAGQVSEEAPAADDDRSRSEPT